MLVHSYAISLLEFPNEVSLCLNVSNCPCKCKGCSEKYLQTKCGDEVTDKYFKNLLTRYKALGITLVGFLGGDGYIEDIKHLSKMCSKEKLKVGFYSGRDYIDLSLIPYLNYYKYGRWIIPEGKPEEWCKSSCGPINFPWSNQRIYKIINNKMVDITEEFRKDPINDLNRYIIKEGK